MITYIDRAVVLRVRTNRQAHLIPRLADDVKKAAGANRGAVHHGAPWLEEHGACTERVELRLQTEAHVPALQHQAGTEHPVRSMVAAQGPSCSPGR